MSLGASLTAYRCKSPLSSLTKIPSEMEVAPRYTLLTLFTLFAYYICIISIDYSYFYLHCAKIACFLEKYTHLAKNYMTAGRDKFHLWLQ